MAPLSPDRQTAALVAGLPKAELHLHLRGAMPLDVMRTQLDRYGTADVRDRASDRLRELWPRFANLRPFLSGAAWTEADLVGLFDFANFDNFLVTFAFCGHFFRCAADLRLLIDRVLDHLAAQQIVDAEITVSVREYLRQGIPLEALLAELDATSHPVVTVRWIVDLVRDFGPAAGEELLAAILANRPRNLVGLTLGGSEHHWPPALFERVYRQARDAGLRRTVHAGEALGPESVWDALRVLGAERLGHGIRAVEDPALVRYLADHQVPLEVCLTSNVRTGVVASYDAHPVTRLLAAGVPVSLSTDDPTFFGTTLAQEFGHLAALGVRREALLEVLRNGYRHAFRPATETAAALRRLELAWRAQGHQTNPEGSP